MPLPKNKIELLKVLKESFEKLDSEYDEISDKKSKLKEIEGGISPCDILAYQIGWGELLLNWELSERRGKQVYMPKKGYKWNELGHLAQSFYKKYSNKNQRQLRMKFKNVALKIILLIEELTEDELFTPHQRAWTGDKWAMVKWIQINTIAPYKSARAKVRRWKKNSL